MSELPDGWEEGSLELLGSWSGGGTPTKGNSNFWSDGTIPWVSPKDMKRDQIAEAEDHISQEALENTNLSLIESGSVLVVTRSGILRHTLPVAVNSVPVTINQDLKALSPAEGVSSDYVALYLRSENRKVLADCSKAGVTVESINFDSLKKFKIPVAPPNEQRRIVEKVDSLLGRSTRARDELGHIPRLIERYKQAVLTKAFRGELTGDMRADGPEQPPSSSPDLVDELRKCGIPASWDARPLSSVVDNFDGKRVPIKAEDRKKRNGIYPYYGASGVIDCIDDYIFDGAYVLVGEDGANLIARSTPIAFIASGKFWVNNHAHVLRAKEETTNEWITQFFNWIRLNPYVTGSAQPKLTQKNLNKIVVPLPRLDEQFEILTRIKTALAWIDRIAHEHENAAHLLSNLDQAVLAKAFRGELVPQDPDDEPASVLLERIREERAKQPKAKRGRGRKKKEATA